MNNLKLTSAQLKVLSSVCANFAVVWLVAVFGTRDPLILTMNFVAVIISLYIAVKSEELSEFYG